MTKIPITADGHDGDADASVANAGMPSTAPLYKPAADVRPAEPLHIPGVLDQSTPPVANDASEVIKSADGEIIDVNLDIGTLADSAAEADTDTDKLVDDIVAHEGDELLAAHDARIQELAAANQPKPSFGTRIKTFFAAWWHNKWARYGTIAGLLLVVGGLGAYPTTRYMGLNLVGVRSAASLTILDNTTQLPLKNVSVTLGKSQAKTNQDGVVQLSHVQLGRQPLIITQRGFATITQDITIGWGSNPLGQFVLNAVGLQYRFKLIDYVSGNAVSNAEANLDDSNAKADDKGTIVLTLDKSDPTTDPVKISADGYRDESVQLDASTVQSRTITMVPADKEIFVTKQSGKYDVYKMDIDGKNREVLLPASGLEDSNIGLAPNDDSSKVAVVSHRDNTKNQDGYPLQALTIVDVASGNSLNLDHSESVQLINWVGSKLVYLKIKAGTSAGNPSRYQLMSYDVDSAAKTQLAAANYFPAIAPIGSNIYYAASNNYAGGDSQFASVSVDSGTTKVLLDKTDLWGIARTGYDTMILSGFQASYTYKFGDAAPIKTGTSPSTNEDARTYIDNADASKALWTDSRDGKNTLLVNDRSSSKDTVLTSASGLTYPLRWITGGSVIYRISTPTESADYVVGGNGSGTPKKITDLTNTAGLGTTQYH